jgi:hypothetical protein
MQTFDLTPKGGVYFAPTYVLTEDGIWFSVKERQKGEPSWTTDKQWVEQVYSIVKLSEELTVVFWKSEDDEGNRNSSIYKAVTKL